jgi:signal transduction histidine kinase
MQHRIKELDKKYQTKQKELQIELQSSQLSQKNIQISLLLMALILILMLIGIYLWYLRQRQIQKEAHIQTQFTQQLLENIEEERGRIAIDLHDSVSHELLSLKRNFAETPDASGKIDGIIDDIRQISRNLHPVMLDKIGLQLSLETLCDQLMQSENIFVAQDIQYHNSLSKSAELQLFRIAQEALTNAHKYAGAEAVQVQLNDKNGQLSLQIRDNGRGFDVDKALSSGKAFGLHSIIQRSKAIGGQANILSSGQGTVIKVRI